VKTIETDFDLNLLRVLATLERTRSVTRAADALEMSQSGFSTALARLRQRFGDALFVRTQAGMEPTPRARRMIETAQAVLHQVQDGILEQPVFDPATARTEFKLAMADVAEIVFMPRLLRHLAEHAPHARVTCGPLPSEVLPPAMESGEVDLALGYFPDLSAQAFFHQRLYTHTYACMMRRGHPLLKTPLTEKSYADAGHAVVSSPARSNTLFEQFLQRRGIERRIVLSTPHHLSLPAIVEETDLLATVPLATGARFVKLGTVELVRLPFKPPSFAVQQHWHRLYHHDPRSTWLRSCVAALFNDGTDEWVEVEAQLYGREMRQRPSGTRSRLGAEPRKSPRRSGTR
jgi:DNA-binding transcriptional LysR family regulator